MASHGRSRCCSSLTFSNSWQSGLSRHLRQISWRSMTDRLPPGLYESLLTLGLRDAVSAVEAEGWTADTGAIDEALLADLLADHVRDATHRTIASVRGDGAEKLAAQVDLVNRLLATVREAALPGATQAGDAVAHP